MTENDQEMASKYTFLYPGVHEQSLYIRSGGSSLEQTEQAVPLT
jgi:hypothetical protein